MASALYTHYWEIWKSYLCLMWHSWNIQKDSIYFCWVCKYGVHSSGKQPVIFKRGLTVVGHLHPACLSDCSFLIVAELLLLLTFLKKLLGHMQVSQRPIQRLIQIWNAYVECPVNQAAQWDFGYTLHGSRYFHSKPLSFVFVFLSHVIHFRNLGGLASLVFLFF